MRKAKKIYECSSGFSPGFLEYVTFSARARGADLRPACASQPQRRGGCESAAANRTNKRSRMRGVAFHTAAVVSATWDRWWPSMEEDGDTGRRAASLWFFSEFLFLFLISSLFFMRRYFRSVRLARTRFSLSANFTSGTAVAISSAACCIVLLGP